MRTQNLRIFLLRAALVARFTSALVAAIALLSIDVSAQIKVPLTMVESSQQTYNPTLEVGIGSLSPLAINFDTGSVGLELYATPGIPGNGTTCSSQKFTVSYGNPLRVTYGGVICNGSLSIAGAISTPNIPFGLLTSVKYCETGFQCTTPQQNYAAGIYGVFGVGLFQVPGLNLPNPLSTLPEPYSERFLVRLSVSPNEPSLLILGPNWNYSAAIFPQGEETYQPVGAQLLPVYAKGQGYVQLSDQPTTANPGVVFDTGNPVPWFHATIPNVSTVVANGDTYVAPGTLIGIAPRLGGPSAVGLIAGDSFAKEFPYTDLGENLINVGVQAFLGNDVTFDSEQGVITVALTRPGTD